MNANFMQAVAALRQIEGGYSDNPADAGGKTNHGVTEKVARAYGYTGDMRDLPYEVAQQIYKKAYWDVLKLDQISAVSQQIAEELFDSCVNCGQTTVGRWFQIALNALNRNGSLYADIAEDGAIGAMTLAAFNEFMKNRGVAGNVVMLRALNSQQGAYYLSLAKYKNNKEFMFGWFYNRVK